MSKRTKKIIIGIIKVVAGLVMLVGFIYFGAKENKQTETIISDAVKFNKEYQQVDKNNLYIYKNISQVLKKMESDTFVLFIGFPECPWCQAYAPLLDTAAKKHGMTKIYYLNILNDRKNNTSEYQDLVSLISGYLDKDEQDNPRIYVPTVIYIKEGKIIGYNNDTSLPMGEETPETYWNEANLTNINSVFDSLFIKLKSSCTICN